MCATSVSSPRTTALLTCKYQNAHRHRTMMAFVRGVRLVSSARRAGRDSRGDAVATIALPRVTLADAIHRTQTSQLTLQTVERPDRLRECGGYQLEQKRLIRCSSMGAQRVASGQWRRHRQLRQTKLPHDELAHASSPVLPLIGGDITVVPGSPVLRRDSLLAQAGPRHGALCEPRADTRSLTNRGGTASANCLAPTPWRSCNEWHHTSAPMGKPEPHLVM